MFIINLNRIIFYIITNLMYEKFVVYSELKKLYKISDDDFEKIIDYLKKNHGIELLVSDDYIFALNDFNENYLNSKKINFF